MNLIDKNTKSEQPKTQSGTFASFANLRQHARFPVRLESIFTGTDGISRKCSAKNISLGGILVNVPQRIALYEAVNIEFLVGEDKVKFNCDAEIRSCVGRRGSYDIGMKFLGMSVNSIDQLNQVLKAEFERRDSDRYAMRTRVETKPVDVPDTYRLQAYSPTSQQDAPADIDQMFGRDISTKGMRLLSDKPYLPGNQLEVHMKFKLGYQLMKANTIVRWCKEDAKLKRFELGIEFTDLDDTSSDFLTSLVSYARR